MYEFLDDGVCEDKVFHLLETEELFDVELAEIVYMFPSNVEILEDVAVYKNSSHLTLEALISTRNDYAVGCFARSKEHVSIKSKYLIDELLAYPQSWVSFYTTFEFIRLVMDSYVDCLYNEDSFFVSEFCEELLIDRVETHELYSFLKLALKHKLKLDNNGNNDAIVLPDGRHLWPFVFTYILESLKRRYETSGIAPKAEEQSVLSEAFKKSGSVYGQYKIYEILKDLPAGEKLLKSALPYSSETSSFVKRVQSDRTLSRHEPTLLTLFNHSALPLLRTRRTVFVDEHIRTVSTLAANAMARKEEFREVFMRNLPALYKTFATEEEKLVMAELLHHFVNNGMSICDYEDIIIETLDSCEKSNKRCFDRFATLTWPHENSTYSVESEAVPIMSDKFYSKILERCCFSVLQSIVSNGLFPSEATTFEALKNGAFDEFSEDDVDEYMLESTADVYLSLMLNKEFSNSFRHYLLVSANQKRLISYMRNYYDDLLRSIIEDVADSQEISEELPYDYRERIVLVGCEYAGE